MADGIERSVDGAGLYNLVGGPQRQMYVDIPRCRRRRQHEVPKPSFSRYNPFLIE